MRKASFHPALLDRETLSAFGPAAVDHVPAGGGAHPFSKTLGPLLFEIAFLCGCFRHRKNSFVWF